MSLTFLSDIDLPLVVGLLTTFPIKYIVAEPPPLRLYAVSQLSSLSTVASYKRDKPLLCVVLPSDTTNT